MATPLRRPPQVARRKVPIGPAIRLLRECKGMRQKELADKAGIVKGMASSYETGRQYPALDTLVKILETLGADFADLQAAIDAVDAVGAVYGVEPTPRVPEIREERERKIGKAVLELAAMLGIEPDLKPRGGGP